MDEKLILICDSVVYYSIQDEEMFFEWAARIPSIAKINGKGTEIYLHVKNNKIPDDDLRELIGLFYRYKVDMEQLAVFLNKDNREWFYEKPRGYWYKKIFG